MLLTSDLGSDTLDLVSFIDGVGLLTITLTWSAAPIILDRHDTEIHETSIRQYDLVL